MSEVALNVTDPVLILVVDDERDICALTKEFLESSSSIKVDIAGSVSEARDAIAQKKYDAIVSDYQMPDEDGIDFLKSLRSLNNNIPFILFTGKGREEVVIEAFNSGADSYLQKGGGARAQFVELEHKVKEAVRRRRSEEALHKSEEKFVKAFYGNGADMFLARANDGLVIDVNDTWLRSTGYRREEVIGKSVNDLKIWKHPEQRAELVCELREHGMASNKEYEFVGKDGRHIVGLLSAQLINIDGEELMLSSSLNITERKRVQEELQRSELMLKTVLDNFPGGVYWKDRNSVYLGANRESARSAGFADSSEFCGKTDFDMPWAKTEAEAYQADDRQVMQSGQAKLHVIESRLQTEGKTGWLDTSKIPLRDLMGNVIGVLGISTDISERKRAEDELRDSEEFHRELMSNLSLGVVIVDPKTRTIETVNEAAAEMFGSVEGNIIGHTCNHYLCPGLEGPCPVHKSGMAVKNLERTLIRADGSRLPIMKTVKRVNIRGEERMLECFMDISERERTQSALLETNKKLNLLSSITRHDINNQLIALTGYLELVDKESMDSLTKQKLLKAEAAAKRISTMIQFTKTYEDIGIQAPTWQNIHSLVERCANEVHLGVIKVVNDVPNGKEIFADPLISKVFFNLIQNAKIHGGNVTSIHCSIEEQDGSQIILFEDDGVGISAEMKDKLFTKGVGKDHGFGLFLSREILAITGIMISEEGGSGRGAKFVITPQPGGIRTY